jgi:hypothetical protein
MNYAFWIPRGDQNRASCTSREVLGDINVRVIRVIKNHKPWMCEVRKPNLDSPQIVWDVTGLPNTFETWLRSLCSCAIDPEDAPESGIISSSITKQKERVHTVLDCVVQISGPPVSFLSLRDHAKQIAFAYLMMHLQSISSGADHRHRPVQ